MTRRRDFAGVHQAVRTTDSGVPARHVWSHWMRRVLGPHEREMSAPLRPAFATHIDPVWAEGRCSQPVAQHVKRLDENASEMQGQFKAGART